MLFILRESAFKKIYCLPNKELKKGDVSCEVLEIKNKGNTIGISEVLEISPPAHEEALEKVKELKTDGKFVEVKFKIRNEGKKPFDVQIPDIEFIDRNKRKYNCLIGRMIPEAPEKIWVPMILPNMEEEVFALFEISLDSELSKLKVAIFYRD